MNKLLSVIAGLFIVGAANAAPVEISSYSWDGDVATVGINAILTNHGLTDYVQVDVETFFGQFADAIIIEEIAANSNINSFGWYEVGTPDVLHEIFPGPATLGDKVTVALSNSPIGFYLDPKNGVPNGTATFYSEQSLNPNALGQVAVFQSNSNAKDFVLAWEDLSLVNGRSHSYDPNISDGDFNDFVVKVNVPEPATLGLLGLSLLSLSGFSMIRRRRR